MRDYEQIVTRSEESIHGVVDESNDKRNHHYYTIYDIYPLSVGSSKMKLTTHIDKMGHGIRGLLYDEKLYITLRDRSGVILGTSVVPMGRAFKLHGQVTYEKDIALPCAFDKIYRIGVHFK